MVEKLTFSRGRTAAAGRPEREVGMARLLRVCCALLLTVADDGNRPRAYMEAQRIRYAAYDGRIPEDLGGSQNPQTFVPLVSQNWTTLFMWQGIGPMPEAERVKLRNIVATAHANGQRVRFWATPELPETREAVWRELLAAEVDYINTDNLAALETFLLASDPQPTEPHVYWNGSAKN
jgi:hypothetical protein